MTGGKLPACSYMLDRHHARVHILACAASSIAFVHDDDKQPIGISGQKQAAHANGSPVASAEMYCSGPLRLSMSRSSEGLQVLQASWPTGQRSHMSLSLLNNLQHWALHILRG